MGIQINGNTNNINAGIGSLSIEDLNELDIVGVATAANFKTGVSNLHSVGLSLSGGQIDVGSNIKIGNAGVITATTFSGSGASLTSIPAGQLTGTVADARISTLTASKLSGALPAIDGSNLTGISAGTSLSGSTNNTVCTVTGANAIQGEANVQIDSGGRLSVGNSQASTQYDQSNDLVIGNTTGSHGMTIISANDNRGRIMFSDTYSANTGRYAGQMLYDHQTETINWYSNYTNNGDVAMQLGGDQHQLFVGIDKGSTATYNNRSAFFHRGTDNFISITAASNHVAGIVFGDTIAANGGNYETYMHHTNSTNDFWIRVNQGNDNRHLKITQAGNVEIGNGNLKFASGHGIDFSDTSDASGGTSELLDDYEEGTWTPTLVNAPSGASIPTHTGYYTKVGNMCTLWLQGPTISGNNSSNNIVQIGGIPFSCASGFVATGIPRGYGVYRDSNHTWVTFLDSGNNIMWGQLDENVSWTQLKYSGLQNTSGHVTFQITLTYKTT